LRNISVTRLILIALAIFVALGSAYGQEARSEEAVSGTFQLGERIFEFTDAVAFKTNKLDRWPDQLVIVVVLTIEPIALQEVTSFIEESGDWTAPNHTRLILRFDMAGLLLGAAFLGYAKEIGGFQVAPDSRAIETKTVRTDEDVRGKAFMPEKASYFGKDYIFSVEYVAKIL
jgi:hypothetical protein